MELRGKRILILGGYGLVGFEVARQVLKFQPEKLIVHSLKKEEVEKAKGKLEEIGLGSTELALEFGNIFTREEFKDLPPSKLREKPDIRKVFLNDIWGELTEEVLTHSFLYQLIQRHRPHLVVDCVNTATAISYQNVYYTADQLFHQIQQAKEAKKNLTDASKMEELLNSLEEAAESCLSSLYIPQLVRHVQILYQALKDGGVKAYIKVGTSGTGGMGMNIPYTHGEERPSRVLLSKSAVAGAHTLLLYILARTPDAPMIKEIKPAAAIAWRAIDYGEIQKGDRQVCLFQPLGPCEIPKKLVLRYSPDDPEWKSFAPTPPPLLQSVFIDSGENGLFARAEFEVITFLNQMEFVTPEEIGRNILLEVQGKNTGRDVIAALDAACMGPTYRAGYLRSSAIAYMKELEAKHNCESIAFEMLGPPRISKLLYECYLLKLAFSTLEKIQQAEPETMSQRLLEILEKHPHVVSEIVSIGLPILLPDGKFLRGPEIKIPPFRGRKEVPVEEQELEEWVENGWVDLRQSNMARWKTRVEKIWQQIQKTRKLGTGSVAERGKMWGTEKGEIEPGEIVGWILTTEDQGSRIKH